MKNSEIEQYYFEMFRRDYPLPEGAVPDLSVDGTVEIERLPNVLYVGRPVFAQPNSTATLFKIDQDGQGAARVPVKFGRASVNAIEVVEGWNNLTPPTPDETYKELESPYRLSCQSKLIGDVVVKVAKVE